MGIDRELQDNILVKCNRRCAICRRLRSTKLQIHHIIERSKGGTDDFDNLLPICISCHHDVHSKVPFAQRFSNAELKKHRDELYRLVAEGKLPAENNQNNGISVQKTIHSYLEKPIPEKLDETAIELLLELSRSESGVLVITETEAGPIIKTESRVLLGGMQPARKVAKYRHALKTLLDSGVFEKRSENYIEITHDGFVLADDIESGNIAS